MEPTDDPETADTYGFFTPADPDPDHSPPTTYTYIDVSDLGLTMQSTNYFCFGYQINGVYGLVETGESQTWIWCDSHWSPQGWTSVLQIKGSEAPGPFGLLTPEDGAVITVVPTPTQTKRNFTEGKANLKGMNVTFSWEYSVLAGGYEIIVDNDSDFTSPEYNEVTSGFSTSIYFDDVSGGLWYWKVTAWGFSYGTDCNEPFTFSFSGGAIEGASLGKIKAAYR